VARKSTVRITASVTASSISHVDFLVNSSVICSSTRNTCDWSVPGAGNRAYQLQVKAFDTAGREGDSAVVTVTAR
jgi:hypothetical protein